MLHYRLLAKLGEGGMGVVWKAVDTKLNREVAIKVLPEAFTADAERLARFEREAKLLASLNHPGIAGIHALEEGPEGRFLVMELVPGEDLAQRLERGPLPWDEALDVGRQVAAALEAAHASGVVHRDLKPANVRRTPDGTIKVLDFGLAKAAGSSPGSASFDQSLSPTMTSAGTRVGTLLGTAAYMSPEQARGKPVDKRADLWSFGCVLYECLTGLQLFQGETATDSLAAVLTKDPDWSTLPPTTPPLVRALLARCLVRDPRRRLQDAGDARVELEMAIEDPGAMPLGLASAAGPPVAMRPRRPGGRLLVWAVIALAAVVGSYFAFARRSAPPPPAKVVRLTIPISLMTTSLPDEFGYSPPAISPDGHVVAYGGFVATGDLRLWLRPLDRFEARPMDGTDGAQFAFWSPDSRHLGFVQSGRLKTLDIETGLQKTLDIEASASGRGGSWGPDGKILFAPTTNSPLYLVDTAGGPPRQVTTLDTGIPDVSHRWPFFLPDGDHFLYVQWTNDLAAMEIHGGIYLGSISGATPARRLFTDASSVAYVPPGYILLVRDDDLIAVPFDAAANRIAGEASIIATGVFLHPSHGQAAFSSSNEGTLVYSGADTSPPSQLTWFDRHGREIGTPLAPVPFLEIRLAGGAGPGRGLATLSTLGANGDPEIALLDLARGVRSRLISQSVAFDHPVLSADGSEILYAAQGTDGKTSIFRRAVDGSGGEEEAFVDEYDKAPFDWSRDGRYIAYSGLGGLGIARSPDIWVHSVTEKTSAVFATGGPSYGSARFSPDGRWLAFDANESGRLEVYVEAFEPAAVGTPGGARAGARFQVSTAGGSGPHWRDDGGEIVYFDLEGRVVAVSVEERNGRLEFGVPEVLFVVPGVVDAADATGDHQHFLVAVRDEVPSEPLHVVLNWPSGL
jgi:eukaryotic-like serine/threonine-protein kinase